MSEALEEQDTNLSDCQLVGRQIGVEWQLVLLFVVAVAIHASRVTDLPIRGEESRRARVAVEMLETGDWIVPRQQGKLFLSRPPLGSWPIAFLGWATGKFGPAKVRWPSIWATALVTGLVYLYARRFTSRFGALTAGLAFTTMGQVLELSGLAETEAIFTLLVSALLLI